jgi:hypothetical protein
MIRIGSVEDVATTVAVEWVSPLVPRPRAAAEVGAPTHPPVP